MEFKLYVHPSHPRNRPALTYSHPPRLTRYSPQPPGASLIRPFFLSLVLIPSLVLAQKPQPELHAHPDWPHANPADVATIESTVKAFYSAISAPAGGKLDQNRLLSLFTPAGRIAVGLPPHDGRPADVLFRTPAEYAAGSDASNATEGFFDRNPANQIERFGVMAHVYSTYESRTHPEDPTPMARGIKSFELLNSDNRWYILQVYWDSERPDNPIPRRYLQNHTN